MPYKNLEEANPAILGIKPPVSLEQANLIAKWADAAEKSDEPPENPWAVAIAQFKRIFKATDEDWVRREETGNRVLRFTANRAGVVRTELIGSVEYLVSPAVLIKPGVLNGELVLGDEIGAGYMSWNGRPVVMAHPTDRDGDHISANDPAVLPTVQVGQLFNTSIGDGGSLRGEIWIDPQKVTLLGNDGKELVRRLKNGKPVEVSTGYWRDLDLTPGTHDGASYYGIARNLRPDHLAVLLHEQGACNWQDGCGAPRVNQEVNVDTDTPDREGRLRCALRTIANALGITYLIESDNGETQAEQPLEVQKEPITNQEANMRQQILDDGRLGLNQDQVDALPDEAVTALLDALKRLGVVPEQVAPEPAEPETEGEPVEGEPQTNKKTPCGCTDDLRAHVATLETTVADLAAQLKANNAAREAEETAHKAQLVGALATNDACAFTEEQLRALDLGTLEGIHRSLSPRDYAGANGGPQVNQDERNVGVRLVIPLPEEV